MAEHTYKYNVTMACSGCSGSVERVLKKLNGVTSYYVSLATHAVGVVVEDNVDFVTVLEKIKETGKKVISREADGIALAI